MSELHVQLDVALSADRPEAERHAAVAVLADEPLEGPGRPDLLRAFRSFLADAGIDPELRARVRARILHAEPGPEPEYLAALTDALAQETDPDALELGHEHLRRIELDPARLAPLLLRLWFRFVPHFPREPLHGWLRDFHEWAPHVPEVRAALPRIAAIARADWLLDRAEESPDPSAVLPGVLEALAAREEGAACRGLDRAWRARALRRSDLARLFAKVLDCPGLDTMRARVFQLLEEGRAVDGDVVDRCLQSLSGSPHGSPTWEVRRFLQRAGGTCPDYRKQVIGAFTQGNHLRWCHAHGDPQDWPRVPGSGNDWEYSGWRLAHPGWPIADLFLDLEPWPEIGRILAGPIDPDVPARRTLAYVLLERLWRRPGEDWSRWCRRPLAAVDAVVRGLAGLLRNAAGRPALEPLLDRAILMFARQWRDYRERLDDRPAPSDLARAAAGAYLELLHRFDRFARTGEPEPAPFAGLDEDALRAAWPFGGERWSRLVEGSAP